MQLRTCSIAAGDTKWTSKLEWVIENVLEYKEIMNIEYSSIIN